MFLCKNLVCITQIPSFQKLEESWRTKYPLINFLEKLWREKGGCCDVLCLGGPIISDDLRCVSNSDGRLRGFAPLQCELQVA